MFSLYNQVQEAVAVIQERTTLKPAVAIILGSGLGDLAAELENAIAVPYAEIPHFAQSTVSGHAGRLLLGTLEDVPVLVMQGRFHFYEGHAMAALTLPVRVMRMLGAETLIVTNAAGGVNPAYQPGDFMLIRDHINLPGLAGANPLIGANEERFGERFPAIAHAYDAQLNALAREIATEHSTITLHEGIYTMVAGPSFETPAELRYLRTIGTDAVGMSTVPEVIGEASHAEVLETANSVRPKFAALVRGIVRRMQPSSAV
jgi:purine-nucleoside phosphorylase